MTMFVRCLYLTFVVPFVVILWVVNGDESAWPPHLRDTEKDTEPPEHLGVDYLSRLRTGTPCNIPVEQESISQHEFVEKYAYKSPVVFRRSVYSQRNEVFCEKCRLRELRRVYGDTRVTVSTANTYSYKKHSMRLDDYLEKYVGSEEEDEQDKFVATSKLKYGNESWYFFGENNQTEWKPLFDLYERPRYVVPNHEYAYSFGVAGLLSGVPFHFHGPGFAETLVGRKRWFFYAPDNKPSFDPDKSTLMWVLEDYERLPAAKKPLECVLDPLDVVYFPDRWYHATLNLDNVVVFMSTFYSPTFKKNN